MTVSPSKPLDLIGQDSNSPGQPRNINSYVNYELPTENPDHLDRDSQWRQSHQLEEINKGRANFGTQRR